MGAECKDDPEGSIYPPMQDLVAAFNASLDGAAAALPRVDPGRWNESPPEARSLGGVMTSMAALANFILVAHPMMHAGQMSSWRRCMASRPSVSADSLPLRLRQRAQERRRLRGARRTPRAHKQPARPHPERQRRLA